MKSPLSRRLLLIVFGTVTAVDAARVNGWYPCSFSTFHDTGNRTSLQDTAVFECSELEVPLCYDSVCDSGRKINLFVRRRVGKMASTDPSVPRKAAILIQGGPGGASPVMEDIMGNLIDFKDDTIDYYTFDHRGTGRSEFLQCDAAQALTPGSPGGANPSIDELPTCLEDLNFQYDGQAAAFSVTSAAMDVRMLIDTFLTNHDVFVSGVSYGTYLAQRILQLQVPQVKGYIFDGVDVLSTKSDPLESANSHWNKAIQAPARRLLEFCFDDPKCPIKMKSRDTVVQDVLAFLATLDNSENACAQVVATLLKKDKPSEAVRFMTFSNVAGMDMRSTGLMLLGAVQRCTDDDLAHLKTFLQSKTGKNGETPTPSTPAPVDTLSGISTLLYNVVVYSERYSQPGPTQQERTQFLLDTPIANDIEELARSYCVYTGSTELACEELKDKLPVSRNNTFFYKRDKYYDEPLTLPDQVSALILNGGLDFATPLEFGELLYSKLKGSGQGVMMVNFDYGTHCRGEGVAESPKAPCHDAIVRQFIQSGGDVHTINTNCMAELPKTAFHLEEKA